MPHRPTGPRATRARPPGPRLPAALAGLLIVSMTLPAWAQADPPSAAATARDYVIPPGPLGQALARFAGQYGVTLALDPALTDGLSTAGLKGPHGIEQGFAQLLQGSGLRATSQGGGVYRVERTEPGSETTLSAVTVTAQADRDVTTEGSRSYSSREVSTARGQAPREIPQSVSLITRQQIEDQNMVSLDDVMAYMPGITTGNLGLGGGGGTYFARGMSANTIQLDGISASGLVPADLNMEGSNLASMAMFDHVEVLRGADGLYSGLGNSSGTINMVRKRPRREARTRINLSAGRWDAYQAEADVTGPVALDGRLRGRLVLARTDSRYFTEVGRSRNDLIYGVGVLDLGPHTALTVGGSYDHDRGTPRGGSLTRNSDGSDPGYSRDASLVAPWSTYRKENSSAFAELRHEFNETWQLNASFNYAKTRNSRYYAVVGQAADEANVRVRGGGYPGESSSWDLNIKGRGEWIGHAYDLLLGVDGNSIDRDYIFRWNFMYAGEPYNRQPVADPLHVDWSLYPRPLAFGRDGLGHLNEEQRSLYGRLKLELLDGLNLVLGGRHARYSYRYTSTSYDADGQQTDRSEMQYDEHDIFTPYLSLVYDIGASWTAYGSVAKIFDSQAGNMTGPPPGTGVLEPLEGRNYEVGVKGDFASGFSTAVALYRLERTGQSAFDSRYPYSSSDQGWCCYVNKGEVVSQGLDAEIQGEVLPRLQASVSYVYNAIRDKTDGDVAYNTTVAPRHLFKLWGRYELPGAGSKFALGGGVTAQSRTYAEGGSFRYQQGGYALLNLFAQYRVDRDWLLGLNLNNVLDRKYYASIVEPGYGNFYGEPFGWTLSLRGSF